LLAELAMFHSPPLLPAFPETTEPLACPILNW